MYQNVKNKIFFLIVLIMLLCTTVIAFASEQKGYLLPEQSIMIDRSDIFVTVFSYEEDIKKLLNNLSAEASKLKVINKVIRNQFIFWCL